MRRLRERSQVDMSDDANDGGSVQPGREGSFDFMNCPGSKPGRRLVGQATRSIMDTRRLGERPFRRRKQRYAIRAHRLDCDTGRNGGGQCSNRCNLRRTCIRRVTRSAAPAIEAVALMRQLGHVRGRRVIAGFANSGHGARAIGRLHALARHHAGCPAKQGVQQWLKRRTVQAPYGDQRGQHHPSTGGSAVAGAHRNQT